jgi:hypothetical protein
MKNKINFRFFENKITVIVLIGVFLRLIYVIFFSKYHALSYYGEANIFAKGPDISMWVDCLDNLIQNGYYTSRMGDPDGYFARMPGYTLIISLFYFLPGSTTYLYFLSFFQVFCDVLNIYFIYRISAAIFDKKQVAYIAAFIYAIHPINMIWAPFLSAESPAVFLMLFSLFIFVCSESKYKFFYFGLIAGFNVLVRPQMAFFLLVYLGYLGYVFLQNRNKTNLKQLIVFSLAVALSYGWWPARNLLVYDELVFSHRISAIKGWGKDVQAYISYNYSVRSNWQPQFGQLITNKKIDIDKKIAYVYPPDSALLAETFFLCQNYGSGFGEWPGYWKKPLKANKYDTIIINNFGILKQHQMKYNSLHYWVELPLENLKKCFFKIELLSSSNIFIKSIAALIFSFRTFIILIGIMGTFLFIARRGNAIILLNFLFFISWYLAICAGDPYFLRNIEMRYLIQCDTLLILPAAYLLSEIWRYFLNLYSHKPSAE